MAGLGGIDDALAQLRRGLVGVALHQQSERSADQGRGERRALKEGIPLGTGPAAAGFQGEWYVALCAERCSDGVIRKVVRGG
ncbi:hypothetical protein HMPREF2806_09015 [Corynebacterium sp. HMSC076G08]|nr:hypothetical protein HMPREF2806_09015 [Corynebacterium sp. HMSC076G08]OFK67212.1 hypothetical protein HMPREF2807_06680 [Corynebacterium sp. HMSC074A09]OFN74322.1 hypothetical protein HMPREF2526_03690 [Corynebacterium sp. HMSC070E08]